MTANEKRSMIEDVTARAIKQGVPNGLNTWNFSDWLRSLYPELYVTLDELKLKYPEESSYASKI